MKQHRPSRRQTLAQCTLVAAAACGIAAPSVARTGAVYPSRPIEMIVAYAPGGGTDSVARLLARSLEKQLGTSIVVQNRPGAGGAIGFAELARAAPDGYTIGFINTPNLLTIPIERRSSFSWRSYDLLGNLVDDPGGFTVHNDHGIQSLVALAAFARANPGAVTVGTTGIGSDDHLAMLLFEKGAGVKLSHIPYKGAGEVRSAIAGQQIVIGAINVGEALQYQKGGTPIRLLGQMGATRSSLAPGIPTFKEQGYDIELASLRGLAAPKGLPEEVRRKLVDAIVRAKDDPQFQQQAQALFAPLRYLPPAAYAAELQRSEAGFHQLWQEMPWQEGRP
ncbi:tripartite tricarboxylate transporter substrate binding protein [Verminephrobacter aporrectodeae subsp. tuberculatae]|uniref:Tripartite tricarboxylate transporter substrate binding protein n=1 Tax=Verminephrobacter aporrectodeae subsp. tuberculatae TaxID=1110392 RepID=A0ABT3KWK3_9BURK|nr:tripartite tricarboxylate transporter substrate binding protein [Verminephrobacter aporrectodeae]MCW5322660.1 tripartite tricarboxylate transporter substrate binding protein [Verminephrobacter aporrectodeae subsp. tuberculatae]